MDAGRALASVGAALVCRAGLRDARSGCAPFVVMMELPDLGDRHDVDMSGRYDQTGVLRQNRIEANSQCDHDPTRCG